MGNRQNLLGIAPRPAAASGDKSDAPQLLIESHSVENRGSLLKQHSRDDPEGTGHGGAEGRS